jgi:integrase
MAKTAKGFTDIAIRNLKPGPVRREIPDAGCVGLYLVLQPSGAKSWAVRYRHNGTPRKLTLAGGLTLKAARRLCAAALYDVEEGHDPGEAKKTAKAKAAIATANTVAHVTEQYFQREHGKLRSAQHRERMVRRLLYPALGTRPIDSVKRSDIVRMLDQIEDKNGQRSADYILQVLRRVMHWHSLRDDNFKSPVIAGMGRYDTAENARSRILTDAEVKAVWQAADESGYFGQYLKFLLLTGCRRAEAGGLKWHEIKDGTWTLPASRSKMNTEIMRPLSKAVMTIVESMPNLGEHVFGFAGRPITSFSQRKSKFDKKCGVRDWRLHDLRRTARTLLSRAGVDADIAERCLGHSLGSIRKIYDRHSFEPEMRIAFEKLSALIENITNPTDRVVPMRGKRRG